MAASHKLVSIIISLALGVPSTHAHTEIQAEKTIICKHELCICKRTCRHTLYECLCVQYVCLSVPVLSVCECLGSSTALFPFPRTSLNTCCEICICAFLDFCQKTCYVDITLRIAATSRWQLEKRWDVFMQMSARMTIGLNRAETKENTRHGCTGMY